MTDQPLSVIVIGAGISGLCAAYWLKKRGFTVTVLEKENSVGGTMKTIHDNGWLVETGPNSALETTPLFRELFDELGIASERIYAGELAQNRYIVKNGMLLPLPMGPGAFIRTKLFSTSGKIRLLKEPFIGRPAKNESIAEFVERRLGAEFLDYAVNPFVAGVYAGDPRSLSVRCALPKLFALEEKYGGLVRGMIGSRRERKARQEVAKDRAKLFSFRKGMHEFPKSIAASLGASVQTGARVESMIPMRSGRYPVYTVSYTQGSERRSVQSDAVILAAPAAAAAEIIRPIDPEMARALNAIEYPPVAEVFTGFRRDQIRHRLDGFGFLVPERERRNVLGTIWSSSLFPDRAPAGHVALASFVGGARQPELVQLGDRDLRERVLGDLRDLLGLSGEPVYERITRWTRAIPQYTLGYEGVLGAIDRFEQNFQGAFICANYRGGISVGDCVMSAERIVRRIAGRG